MVRKEMEDHSLENCHRAHKMVTKHSAMNEHIIAITFIKTNAQHRPEMRALKAGGGEWKRLRVRKGKGGRGSRERVGQMMCYLAV
jgi:hypothetical protein